MRLLLIFIALILWSASPVSAQTQQVCVTSPSQTANYNLFCMSASASGGSLTVTNNGSATGGLNFNTGGTTTFGFNCVDIVSPPACDSPTTPAWKIDTAGRIFWSGQAYASIPGQLNTTGAAYNMIGANGSFPGLVHYGYNGGFGNDIFFYSHGNLGSEALPQSLETLGNFGFRGWNGTSAYTPNQAVIRVDAAATWSAGASYPTLFTFRTTAVNSTAMQDALNIFTGVVIGAGSTDPGAGALAFAANTFSTLAGTPVAGSIAYITDALAGNCGDTSCTTWGTTVTGGSGALKRLIWYNGTNWTLIGK